VFSKRSKVRVKVDFDVFGVVSDRPRNNHEFGARPHPGLQPVPDPALVPPPAAPPRAPPAWGFSNCGVVS